MSGNKLVEELIALKPGFFPSGQHLTKCTELSLYHGTFTQFPLGVCLLPKLKTLWLSHNQLSQLPRDISRLTTLTLLCVSDNRLASMPLELTLLTGLLSLGISDNPLNMLPPQIWALTSLSVLSASGNCISYVSPEISLLRNLKELYIHDNQISALPAEFSRLTGLSVLRIQHNHFRVLPQEIWSLLGLEELNVRENPITELPPWITVLSKLKKLFIEKGGKFHISRASKGLTSLPVWTNTTSTDYKYIRALELYDAGEYWAEYITNPDCVFDERVRAIESLSFVGKNLTTLPATVSMLTNLKELHIHGNPIEDLPAWITALSGLKTLSIEDPKAWFSKPYVKRAPRALSKMACWNKAWDKKITFYDSTDELARMRMEHSSSRKFSVIEPPVKSPPKDRDPNIVRWLNSVKKEKIKTKYLKLNLSVALLDDYPILGSGGFGIVFQIELDGQKYALKAPKEPTLKNGEFINDSELDVRELNLLLTLRHANIISILDIVHISLDKSDFQYCCFLLELAERPLNKEILRWEAMDAKTSYTLAIRYVSGILQGLRYLHEKNIVHRDLKTDNILIVGGMAKITDFGMSKKLEKLTQTVTEIKGSAHWFSPEYFSGDVSHQKATDIFSVGTILWSMRTRKLPFNGFNHGEVGQVLTNGFRLPIPDTNPPHILRIIQQAWMHHPDERPSAESILLNMFDGHEEANPSIALPPAECQLIWGTNEEFEKTFAAFVKSRGMNISVTQSLLSSVSNFPKPIPTKKAVKDMKNVELLEYIAEINVNSKVMRLCQENELTGFEFISMTEEELRKCIPELLDMQVRVTMAIIEDAKKS